jgi:Zn-dependent peptidase ImmA (M78 family)
MTDKERLLKEEAEANKFAYELLMPKHMIVKAVSDITNFDFYDDKCIRKLSNLFKVSTPTMVIRLNQIFPKQIEVAT